MAWPKGKPRPLKVDENGKRVLVPRRKPEPAISATAASLPSWAEGGVVVGVNNKFVKVRFPNGMCFVGDKE